MRFITSLWIISLLAKLAYVNTYFVQNSPLPVEEKALSSDENGQFTVQWNLNIGNQSSVLDTSYLKAGLEQAVKDFINLKLRCDPTKRNVKTAFRSLAIRKITTTTGKQQILSGIGKCIGSQESCKTNVKERDSTERKTRTAKITSIQKSDDPCEDFETTTIFDLFDKKFVEGLFFNYNVDLEAEKQKLKESLELDFNVSFIPTKSESLESIDEVDLSFKRMKEATSGCSSPQCTVQKDVILDLFRHFGDGLDESLHECEQTNIMCHEDDLVKYIRINNQRPDATIPDIISKLPSLYGIFFEGEQLVGTIPSAFGQLNALRLLWLTNNKLTGTVPEVIGNLTKLQEVNLRGNRLRGTIPTQLGSMTKLRMVNLGRNFFQGPIPEFSASETIDDDDVSDEEWPPTASPTRTVSPSASPTVSPSASPTASPSASPTISPSASPTRTVSPSASPTRGPTSLPSMSPFPTLVPTLTHAPSESSHPSAIPTTVPSNVPTYISTKLPSVVPSENPSTIPTTEPSNVPTYISTKLPSVVPSETFSAVPSEKFADAPSASPSVKPSSKPGITPTLGVPTLGCRPGRLKEMLLTFSNRLAVKNEPTYRLVSLSLYNNKLTGKIPSGVYDLRNLRHLNLAGNLLTSPISSKISNLNNLKILDVHENYFSGSIPNEIGNLDKMELLNFYNNRLVGTVPDGVGNLNKLKELVMDKNKLTGPLPPRVGNCQALQYLSFSENLMKGYLPSELGSLSQLEHLDFRDFEIVEQPGSKKTTGTLPTELGQLLKWKYILLQNNNFRGGVPAEYGNLESTEALWLKGDNVFVGDDRVSDSIDGEGISNISSIRYINLNNMGISGHIPSIFGDLKSLVYMSMANNELTGTIPTELGQLGMLEGFFLSNNELTGPLPSEIGNLHRLKEFAIENNDFVGTIPSQVGNMLSLRTFLAGDNKLTGPIPSEVGQWKAMKIFNVSNNILTGKIPSEIGLMSAVLELDLSDNFLERQVPSEIRSMELVQYLSIGHNQFTGLPIEIRNLREMKTFIAGHNHLTKIPTEIGNLKKITYLDIGHNHITEIPTETGNLKKITYLDVGHNRITEIPTEIGNLRTIKYMDVGQNNLTTSLPMEMGRSYFIRSINTLNVGGNENLSGTIPNGIKNYILGGSKGFLQIFNMSKTNILYDENLCELPAFLCDESSPSPVASSPPSISSSFCIKLRIFTDGYGLQTSWKIARLADDKVLMTEAFLKSYTLQTHNKCLVPGCYKFVIYDDGISSIDQGICCSFGNGFYDLSINNLTIFEGGEFDFKQEHIFCDPSFGFSPSSSAHPTHAPLTSTSLVPSISFHPTLDQIPVDNLFSFSKTIFPPYDGFFSDSTLDISLSYVIIGTGYAMYVYNTNGLYLRTIRGYDSNEGDGFSLSLSIHNELIVVGSPYKTRGKAYIFHVSGDIFGELTPPDSMDWDFFGWSVGISNTHIVIGAPGNERGKAYVYTTILNPVGIPLEIIPNDIDERGWFARSLSISGSRVVCGAPSQDNWRGVAYVYDVMGKQIAKLRASDGQSGDKFGIDVAIDGFTVAVGAYEHDNNKGAMYVYDGSGNEINKVMDPAGEIKDYFGRHVYISSQFIAVRTRNSVFICDKAGKILDKRDATGRGDVALMEEKLVVYDGGNRNVILMQNWDYPSATPSLSFSPSISLSPTKPINVVVEIQTDGWGSETSWEITHSGSVMAFGNGYGNNQLYVIEKRLPNGCYKFVIRDSYGDGIYSTGYFKLFVEDELMFEKPDGRWSELSKSFCFGIEYPTPAPSSPSIVIPLTFRYSTVDWKFGSDDIWSDAEQIGVSSTNYDATHVEITNRPLQHGETFSITGNKRQVGAGLCVDICGLSSRANVGIRFKYNCIGFYADSPNMYATDENNLEYTVSTDKAASNLEGFTYNAINNCVTHIQSSSQTCTPLPDHFAGRPVRAIGQVWSSAALRLSSSTIPYRSYENSGNTKPNYVSDSYINDFCL